ncbi:hypothetical protein K439DRAFT_1623417 [Ramaria rubella]|nr:hypothetical protein K439DRAFT_1623417 [Ramaria rubella]
MSVIHAYYCRISLHCPRRDHRAVSEEHHTSSTLVSLSLCFSYLTTHSVAHFLVDTSPMTTPTTNVTVFVHNDMIFMSPNMTVLPVIPRKPYPNCLEWIDSVHPREMLMAQWSYNAFPYLAYVPTVVDFRLDGFMSLVGDHHRFLIEQERNCWKIAVFVAESWSFIERGYNGLLKPCSMLQVIHFHSISTSFCCPPARVICIPIARLK